MWDKLQKNKITSDLINFKKLNNSKKNISLGFNNHGIKSLTSNYKNRIVEEKEASQQEGLHQHLKEQAVKSENDRERVEEMVRKSNRLIFSISTFLSYVFPWSLFASTLEIEESRVTFIFRQPFSSQSHSLEVKDISNIFIEKDLFFASIQVVSRTFIQNDIKIKYLRKSDAMKMRIIIEGMRTFMNKNIDTSNYEIKELVDKLQELYTVRA